MDANHKLIVLKTITKVQLDKLKLCREESYNSVLERMLASLKEK